MNKSKLREIILAFLLVISFYISFYIIVLSRKTDKVDIKVDSIQATITQTSE